MMEDMVKPDRPQMTMWEMCIAYWIAMATDTHSEYVKVIDFLRKQLLRESASVLHLYLYCLSFFYMRTNITLKETT